MVDPIKTTGEIVDKNNVQGDPALDPNKIQVNVDELKKTKVHICMPCYGGMLTESTFMSHIAPNLSLIHI